MSLPFAEQLSRWVHGDVEALFLEFAAQADRADADLFVLWLVEQGKLDAEKAQLLLMTERKVVSSGPTLVGATLSEATPTYDPDISVDTSAEVRAADPDHGHIRLARIGAGAMGEVFLVRDEALGRKVAYKVVNDRAAARPTLVRRFLTEAQISAQLEHPNIIPVYRYERDDEGRPAYSMKLVQGRTFKQYLIDCRRFYERAEEPDDDHSLEARLEHFLKVCDAVAYAHARGVLHRDLKPENFMLGAYNEVLVLDWGIARLMHQPDAELGTLAGTLEDTSTGGRALTQMGQAVGTPAYMSPEQARGENETLDGRSDLYALGLILQELVTLERAVIGDSPTAMLSKAKRGYRAPMAASSDTPRELHAIVGKATAFHPEERYPGVEAFADDIRRYLRNEEVLAAPDNALQRLERWVGRHQEWAVATVLALVGLVAMIALGAGVVVAMQQAEAQHREAQVAHLVGAVSEQAHRVDARLLRYTALLESLGGTAVERLTREPAEPGVHVFNADFEAPESLPMPAAHHSRYGRLVSFDRPVFKLAPGVQVADVGSRLDQLSGLDGAFRRLFLRSHADQDVALTREQADALFRGSEVPVVWSYVAVQDGIHTSFPGHGGYPASYDPRERPWYREAVLQHGPHWSAPYVDVNGLGLILPCNLALRDEQGELLGVAGLELTFARVIRELLLPRTLEGAEEAYLVNDQGQIVVQSSRAGSDVLEDEDLTQAADLPVLEVAGLTEAMAGRPTGVWSTDGELFAWSRLTSIEWTYVVRGREAPLLVDEASVQP